MDPLNGLAVALVAIALVVAFALLRYLHRRRARCPTCHTWLTVPREELGPVACGHDRYWTTLYGNCMACRAKSEEVVRSAAAAVVHRFNQVDRLGREPDLLLAALVTLLDAALKGRPRA